MKYLRFESIVIVVLTSLAACASNPDVGLNYYLAKTDVTVKVTRTVMCDANENLFVASAASVTPSHTADTSEGHSFELDELSGAFSNIDMTISLHEDGRLKGLNTTSTGQGEAILGSALKVASYVFGGGTVKLWGDMDISTKNPACTFINSGDLKRDKTVTMTFEGKVDLDASASMPIPPTVETQRVFLALAPYVGEVHYKIGELQPTIAPVSNRSKKVSAAKLQMRQPALQYVKVYSELDGAETGIIWHDRIAIAQKGISYTIPISKSQFFGTQTFALEVAPSGALAKLGYGSDSGLAQGLSSTNALLEGVSKATDVEKAAVVKGEADLIAQQQRLLRCQMNTLECV